MDGEDRPGSRPDGFFDARSVDVEGAWLNVDEHGRRAAVPHGVRGRDERMTDRDDLVARLHPNRQQGQVQRGRAVRHGAGMLRAHSSAELPLERRHLGTLGQPARLNHSGDGVDFGLAEERLGDGNLRHGVDVS